MEDKSLKATLDADSYQKLKKMDNPELIRFITRYKELCNPDDVFVCTGSREDVQYIRAEAIRSGEERELATEGHTVHFDGYYDQARDKKNTKFLLPPDVDLGPGINAMDRDEGLKEIHEILRGIMRGHRMYVLFFCLGPLNSQFSIPAVQITDSSYVAHSECLLYRQGYTEFVRMGRSNRFFKFVHSAGELDARKTSINIAKRRIYIDLETETVYSTNTQYGGNTIGLKKLALRLALNRASKEGWLTEHMFIMGVHGPDGRVTYFTGAFPSLCGKTSTSMLKGESIVGDDIAYLRNKKGVIRAVNPEKGIFGIIQGVNSRDDPIIWNALHAPGEIIFSNVLVTDAKMPYWSGNDSSDPPTRGYNHAGEWVAGARDEDGNEIPVSHPNARFTLDMHLLENLDPELDNPEGVEIRGIIYGGRDSDTRVPVEESFDWVHGVITMGAALESETTAATLGTGGERKINPMSNLDFLSIPIGRYIENHLRFGMIDNPPRIFAVNYFLKDADGNFLNARNDKAVWLKWMELRTHNEIGAIKTPTGLIPRYNDLKKLFRVIRELEYQEEAYIKQFTVRVPENLAKLERVEKFYRTKVPDTPQTLFIVLEEQRERLIQAREEFGDYISPFALADTSL